MHKPNTVKTDWAEQDQMQNGEEMGGVLGGPGLVEGMERVQRPTKEL